MKAQRRGKEGLDDDTIITTEYTNQVAKIAKHIYLYCSTYVLYVT